jgi:glucosamine-phosphate N-acetyltransferase
MTNVTISILDTNDIHNGFLETISALQDPELTQEQACQIHLERGETGISTYVAKLDNMIVGTFSVFIEKKFIHSGGKVAHIEDVAVKSEMQRQGIGREMMKAVDALARRMGCYKVILDCGDNNIGFYENCGYRLHEKMMRKDI